MNPILKLTTSEKITLVDYIKAHPITMGKYWTPGKIQWLEELIEIELIKYSNFSI